MNKTQLELSKKVELLAQLVSDHAVAEDLDSLESARLCAIELVTLVDAIKVLSAEYL